MNLLNVICALFFPFTDAPSIDVIVIPKESIAQDYQKAIYFCPAEMVAVSVQNDVSPGLTRIRSPTRCDFFVGNYDMVSVLNEFALMFVHIRSPTI